MSGLSTGKASAVLILVMSISLFQAAVFLIQPKNTNVMSIRADTPPGPTSSSTPASSSSSSQSSPPTQTVIISTTVPTTVPTTVLLSVTNTTTIMSQPRPDYTPIGIAIVVAIGIIALVIMFVRRRR